MSSSECGLLFIFLFCSVDIDAIFFFCGCLCFAFSTLPSTVLYLIYVTTIHRINSNKWMFFVCVLFFHLNFSHWSKDLRIIYFCSAIENEAKLSLLIQELAIAPATIDEKDCVIGIGLYVYLSNALWDFGAQERAWSLFTNYTNNAQSCLINNKCSIKQHQRRA